MSLVLFVINVNAQTKKESFLSRVYFPFNLGYSLTSNSSINSGGLIKTGVEYRLKKSNGLFMRFNFDNRSNYYKIPENSATNVTEGKIKFNDNIIGIGYRLGKQKLKAIGLLQAGVLSYGYSTVTGTTNDYKIIDKKANVVICKFILGAEYYIRQNAAITIEIDYFTISKHSIFLGNVFGISLGYTTTIF